MKKLLAVLLAVTIVMSMGVVAFAAEHSEGDSHGNTSGANVDQTKSNAFEKSRGYAADSKLYLRIDKDAVSDKTQINATVPLWVCMYAYGGDGVVVTPITNVYKITKGNMSGQIKVTNVEVAPQNEWSIVAKPTGLVTDPTYDATTNTLAAKQMTLKIKDVEVPAVSSGSTVTVTPTAAWKTTDTAEGGVIDLPLECWIAPNGVNGDETLQDVQVVNVTYTISLAA